MPFFLSVVLCTWSRCRKAPLKPCVARHSHARSLGVYKVWDSASLKRRYMKADGPVVAEHGRRRLKKVCCGRRDVLDEGAETSQECKEAVCRGHAISRSLEAWEVLYCGGKSRGAGVQGQTACLPPPGHPGSMCWERARAEVWREAKTGRGERKGREKPQEECGQYDKTQGGAHLWR